MIQDEPQTNAPASDDQLAALYLRGRDTPCPSCNYNRRDGTTSRCPECGTAFVLTEAIASTNANYQTLSTAILLFTTLIALAQAAHHFTYIALVYFSWGSLWSPGIRLWSLVSTIGVVTWLITALSSGRYWFRARQTQSLSTHHVITPIVIIFVVGIVQTIVWLLLSYI